MKLNYTNIIPVVGFTLLVSCATNKESTYIYIDPTTGYTKHTHIINKPRMMDDENKQWRYNK